jgi:hypothetical protein
LSGALQLLVLLSSQMMVFATAVQQADTHIARDVLVCLTERLKILLSGAALADLPPQINENADFGPNEVSKQTIKDTSVGADNPFDQAAPGEFTSGCHAAGIGAEHF